MLILSLSFIASLVVTLLLIRYDHLHRHLSADHDMDGVQKFHAVAVPRIGGVGVLAGALIGALGALLIKPGENQFGLLVLLCGSVAFIAGIVEDFTKKVGVKERLIATAISGLLGGFLLGGWLTRLDIPGLDYLIAIQAISILVTCVAISGVANAYNIIDGYNGLAGVVSIIVLLGIVYVARQVGDTQIESISLAMVGAISGFLVWNFPRGLIFLGDGGAYLIGFVIAELSVLLVARNPAVSPWFPLLLSFYPIFETIFSMYRKRIKRGASPGVPDGLHLHMLIYKRVVRWAVGTDCIKEKTARNALTSPYLWLLSTFTVIPAVLFWNNTLFLIGFTMLFVVNYVFIYRNIVRVKVPSWMTLRARSKVANDRE
jgi:UDP-N-acetylmuramyl pentapeptide phosphotransferase/UDP-N-acetylglucosamine-1-phosphate transferase